MTLPNFLVIGAEKCGTTWLYSQLKEHPEIFLPETKEVHFFNRFNSNLIPIDNFQKHGISWYESFFRNVKNQKIIGEITPMYLCDPLAPARIKTTLANIKIIILLRNPVQRAYSHYWMAYSKGHTKDKLEVVVESKDERFIGRGLYYHQLKRYFDLFSEADIKVMTYEDLFSNVYKGLEEIYTFLGVENRVEGLSRDPSERVYGAGTYKSPLLYRSQKRAAKICRQFTVLHPILDAMKKYGVAKKIETINRSEAKYPPMPEKLQRELEKYYVTDIHQTAELIKTDLSGWKSYSND